MARNQQAATSGRDDYLKDPDFFMAAAVLSAQRSKDPSTQVGACIVKENEIVAMGYNRMPNGDDGTLPWARNGTNELEKKYFYVCHAELNAIINKSKADVNGCTMYVTLFPCNECAKLIIRAGSRNGYLEIERASGLEKVVYLSDKYHNDPQTEASRRMLNLAQIPFTRFTPTLPRVNIDLISSDNPGSENV